MGSAETADAGSVMMGYVPALLNEQLVRLMVIFDDEHPAGFVAGAQPAYTDEETDTVSRGLIELQDGDRLDFICDFYSYDGEYQDSYFLGEPVVFDGELTVSDTLLGGTGRVLYRFTDIYQQHYWTEILPEG